MSPPVLKNRDEYADERERGLYLYVSRGGTKTFFLYLKFQNKPLRFMIGRFPEFSVAEARECARDLKGRLARGDNPKAQTKEQKAQAATLGEIGAEYLRVRNLSKTSLSMYRGRLELQLKAWKELPILEINKDQLVKLHRNISEKSGNHMADMTLRIFGAFFNFFMDRYDHPGPNPVKTLSANKLWKTKASDRRSTYINKHDLSKWFKIVTAHTDVDQRDYLLLLLFTGMRRTEACKLRWENIDFGENIFTAYETKNGKPLVLPMNSYLRELFESRQQNRKGEWVFPSRRNRRKPMPISTLAANMSKLSGIDFTLHDLRRTFLTLIEELDLSPYVIKRFVNHSTAGDVTAGYIISEVDRMREPSERICQWILSLVK